MPYVLPENVIAPVALWQHQDPPMILHDGGPGCWSAAKGTYDGKSRLAIRWNGNDESPWGFPNRGKHPTWFIVPRDLEKAIRTALRSIEP